MTRVQPCTYLVVQKLLVGLCAELKVGTLNNGVDRAGLLHSRQVQVLKCAEAGTTSCG